MIRSHFDEDLKQLHREIVDMGSFVETAIASAVTALKSYDVERCKEIIESDKKVDEMERKIESQCLWLIARQQPVASDLRQITTALKIITDMERIGDHASDIASLAIRITDRSFFPESEMIFEMAAAAIDMVNSAVMSYVNYDMELAKATEEKDDIVDDYFNKVKHYLADVFSTQPHRMDVAIDYLLVAKYLERIGDHAVNICEWVHFSQTGEHKSTKIF
ncbi:MAG: phosphate signaling complex protein PhoU [Oscillospiraceae bacterium]|jgi:phosphate transport system protein|nr:phosphate signaling complex protein PhoU [Oscillospiraceae bacterium]